MIVSIPDLCLLLYFSWNHPAGKKVLIALVFFCLLDVMWLFSLFVSSSQCLRFGLQCVIVTFPGHTYLNVLYSRKGCHS